MQYSLVVNNSIILTVYDTDPVTVDNTQYPANIDKSTIPGLVKVIDNIPDPTQYLITGSSITLVNNIPTKVYQTQTIKAPPVVEPIPPTLTQQANALLGKSDVTLARCYENGIPLPAEWVTYRQTLRSIVVSNMGTIPSTPAYPSNT